MKVPSFASFVKPLRILTVLLPVLSALAPAEAATEPAAKPKYRKSGSAYVPPSPVAKGRQAATPEYPVQARPTRPVPRKWTEPVAAPTAGRSTTAAKKPLTAGTEAPTGKLYKVRPGDTLWRIADRHGTSINAIRQANRLTGDQVATGQALLIPAHAAPAAAALPARMPVPVAGRPAKAGGSYTVRPGDTFMKVAREQGVSYDALVRANPKIQPERLQVGARLLLPGSAAAVPTVAAVPPPERPVSAPVEAAVPGRKHVVAAGESLGAIARKYGITTTRLAEANRLQDANRIVLGQTLQIPGGRPEAVQPKTVEAPPAPVAPVLVETPKPVVPQPEPAPVAAPAPPQPVLVEAPPAVVLPPEPALEPVAKLPVPPAGGYRGIVAYRLERGDDIHTVASLFNTSAEKIRELNKLPPDQALREGDEVVVPTVGAVSLN